MTQWSRATSFTPRAVFNIWRCCQNLDRGVCCSTIDLSISDQVANSRSAMVRRRSRDSFTINLNDRNFGPGPRLPGAGQCDNSLSHSSSPLEPPGDSQPYSTSGDQQSPAQGTEGLFTVTGRIKCTILLAGWKNSKLKFMVKNTIENQKHKFL